MRAAAGRALTLLATPSLAADGLEIKQLIVAATMTAAQRETVLKPVRAFYDFWNTGDEALLKQAIGDDFTDRTLPPGRPQGPQGPASASRQFRGAVPDLNVTVEKVVVAGDFVTTHMTFNGHFTGTFGQTTGRGQAISFIATDLVRIEGGRITDNWHIEDNLTLLRQMGVVAQPGAGQ